MNGCGRIDKDSYEGVIGMIACPGKSLKRLRVVQYDRHNGEKHPVILEMMRLMDSL